MKVKQLLVLACALAVCAMPLSACAGGGAGAGAGDTTAATMQEEITSMAQASETGGEEGSREAETGEMMSEKEGETRTIVDHTGVEVEIPANPQRIVISSILPLPSVYCMFRGRPPSWA